MNSIRVLVHKRSIPTHNSRWVPCPPNTPNKTQMAALPLLLLLTIFFAMVALLATPIFALGVDDTKMEIGYYTPMTNTTQLYAEMVFPEGGFTQLTKLDFHTIYPTNAQSTNLIFNLKNAVITIFDGRTGKAVLSEQTIMFPNDGNTNTGVLNINYNTNKATNWIIITAKLTFHEDMWYKRNDLRDTTNQPSAKLTATYRPTAESTPAELSAQAPYPLASLKSTPYTKLYPIRTSFDPRTFRFKINIDTDRSPSNSPTDLTSNIKTLTIKSFNAWGFTPRTNAEDVHCVVNSHDFSVATTPTALVLTRPTAVGLPDQIMISCPDTLLSQKLTSDIDYKPQHNSIFVEAVDEANTLLWTAAVQGPIYDFMLNPTTVRGGLYLEAHTKLAVGSFLTHFDGDAQGMKATAVLPPKTHLQLSTHNVHWVDDVTYSFVSVEDMVPFLSKQFTRTANYHAHNANRNTFSFHKDLFNAENAVFTDFTATLYGPYTPNAANNNNQKVVQAELEFQAEATISNTKTKAIVKLPYQSRIYTPKQPTTTFKFHAKEANFKVDLMGLKTATTALYFAFPKQTYRFAGQFVDCTLYQKQLKAWKKTGSVLGKHPITGQSFGSLDSLMFQGPIGTTGAPFVFQTNESYRIHCPNGVTGVRTREIQVVEDDLLQFYYYPQDSQMQRDVDLFGEATARQFLELSATPDDVYQTTLIFEPRETSHIILFTFVFFAVLVGCIALGYATYYFGLWRMIKRLTTPAPQYGMDAVNLSQNNKYTNLH